MSYALIETSDISAAPVELYEITYGSTSWRYTSGDVPVVYNLHTYEPLALYRSALRPAVTKEKADLTLNLPVTAPVGQVFLAAPPSEIVLLTVYRQHRTDVDLQTMVVWMGRILNAKYDEYEIEFLCESIMSSMQRSVLTRTYQKGCPHVLYGAGCNLNAEDFKIVTTVNSVSGVTVNVPAALANGYLNGGFIEYSDAITNNTERRFVVSNTAGAITLGATADGLVAGMSVKLYPGCAHTMSACKNKFNNLLNYGGQPWIPSQNPFGNAPIY